MTSFGADRTTMPSSSILGRATTRSTILIRATRRSGAHHPNTTIFPSVASAFLELLVLVASANQSRFDQIAPFLDNSFAFVLRDHDETDFVVVKSAIRSFFQVCALRTTNVFDLLPATFDALSETADESLAPEVCKGLEETRRIDADDIQGWKTWFRILAKCLKRSKSNNTRISSSSSSIISSLSIKPSIPNF